MPRIFDNIEQPLLDALLETLRVANRADFCVGYFNLRGWKQLDSAIERWAGGDGNCCRLLVGMQQLPQDDLRTLFRLDAQDEGIDNQTALRLKKKLVGDFRDQLTWGAPSDEDEAGLRHLAAQIKAGKVVVKLFLAYPLHAKLYLLFRPETVNPGVGLVGSSNLTLAGDFRHQLSVPKAPRFRRGHNSSFRRSRGAEGYIPFVAAKPVFDLPGQVGLAEGIGNRLSLPCGRHGLFMVSNLRMSSSQDM